MGEGERRFRLIKLKTKNGVLQQISMKSKGLLQITTKTFLKKCWKVQEMDKFLDTYDLPKLIRKYKQAVFKHIHSNYDTNSLYK